MNFVSRGLKLIDMTIDTLPGTKLIYHLLSTRLTHTHDIMAVQSDDITSSARLQGAIKSLNGKKQDKLMNKMNNDDAKWIYFPHLNQWKSHFRPLRVTVLQHPLE